MKVSFVISSFLFLSAPLLKAEVAEVHDLIGRKAVFTQEDIKNLPEIAPYQKDQKEEPPFELYTDEEKETFEAIKVEAEKINIQDASLTEEDRESWMSLKMRSAITRYKAIFRYVEENVEPKFKDYANANIDHVVAYQDFFKSYYNVISLSNKPGRFTEIYTSLDTFVREYYNALREMTSATGGNYQEMGLESNILFSSLLGDNPKSEDIEAFFQFLKKYGGEMDRVVKTIEVEHLKEFDQTNEKVSLFKGGILNLFKNLRAREKRAVTRNLHKEFLNKAREGLKKVRKSVK